MPKHPCVYQLTVLLHWVPWREKHEKELGWIRTLEEARAKAEEYLSQNKSTCYAVKIYKVWSKEEVELISGED